MGSKMVSTILDASQVDPLICFESYTSRGLLWKAGQLKKCFLSHSRDSKSAAQDRGVTLKWLSSLHQPAFQHRAHSAQRTSCSTRLDSSLAHGTLGFLSLVFLIFLALLWSPALLTACMQSPSSLTTLQQHLRKPGTKCESQQAWPGPRGSWPGSFRNE